MKRILMTLVLCLIGLTNAFACEILCITTFGSCSSEYKVKGKCDVIKQETNKMLLQLDHNKNVVCLGKVEENGSVIMTYDNAGVEKKIIFKKCNKNKLKNKLYYIYLIGLYNERSVF